MVGTTTVHTAPNADRFHEALGRAARGYHPDVVSEEQPEHTVAEAASAAAEETAEAIQVAAEENRDPVVARALDDAALKADKTVSRVGWLRALLRRLVPRADPAGEDAASGAS
jgi:inorganic triphosphatase YgiF